MTSSVFTPFLRRFTDEVQLERAETITLYNHIRAKHLNSVWAAPDIREAKENLEGFLETAQTFDGREEIS